MDPGVTIVVPSYNSGETIAAALKGVLAQKFNGRYEILVIDDCSMDQTVEICSSLGLKVFRNDKNIGLAASLNKGIALSKSNVVVTLHADATPLSENWLSQLVASLDREDVGASCSLQHSPDFNQPGFTIWEKFLWGRVLPHHALNNKADAYKRRLFDEIGAFDAARFRTAGEDEDMGLRLRLNGWTLVGTAAEIQHNHRYAYKRGAGVFGMIMKKDYSFGRAGGALRRKFPRHRPGAFVYPEQKPFFNDGIFRTFVCIGSLVPFLQWICIPSLAIMSVIGIRTVARRSHLRRTMLAYPFFNAIRYWCYTVGYLHGIFSGKQR